jgi:putative component of membrane protein insertase Oxa1/YidC/SpoIIIJ protein YidD
MNIPLASLFALSISVSSAFGQKHSDWERWEASETQRNVFFTAVSQSARPSSSPNLTVAGMVFSAYKFLVSDQDGPRCPFTPSCAEFALQAWNTLGPIRGVLLTADRLTRDTNLSKDGLYPLRNHHYDDPLERYIP